MPESVISGTFIYRSLFNDIDLEQDFSKLELGRGTMVITQTNGDIKGTFDMGGGYLMTLEGSVYSVENHSYLRMTAYGKPGTLTAGWVYDYSGVVTPIWPNAINQIPTITGSVIRTVTHGNSKAGVTATFYMVFKNN